MLEYTEYTKFLIGIIAIVNPVGAIPVFMSLTSEASSHERRAIAKVVVLSVFIILLTSLFLGEAILNFFGITIDSFRVAGGILILLMAIAMLQAKTSPVKTSEAEVETAGNQDSIAVVPLAMPLLAGPGAISTVILYAHKGTGISHFALISLDIFILSLVLFVSLLSVPMVSKYISQTGINIFTRIMGLILSAIAIEFIANGLKGLFPALV